MRDLGRTVSKIRKNKHIPISYLTRGIMASSTYERFVAGKTSTSIDKFIQLLQRLNVSLQEFQYINNGYYSFLNSFHRKLYAANSDYDFTQLRVMSRYLAAQFDRKTNLKYNHYFHAYCVVNLMIEMLHNQRCQPRYATPIKNYLLSCSSWSYYELSLFHDCFYCFDPQIVDIFIKQVLRDLRYYKYYPNDQNQVFPILLNATVLFIRDHDLDKAQKVIDYLKQIPISRKLLFYKIAGLDYDNDLLMIINGDRFRGFRRIHRVFRYLKVINSKMMDAHDYYAINLTFYHRVLKSYGIKDPAVHY